MNFIQRLITPKVAVVDVNNLLAFLNMGNLLALGQKAKEKIARFRALAEGKISTADAKQAHQDLLLQKRVAIHAEKSAKNTADKAAAAETIKNLETLIAIADSVIKGSS